jgi:very-short-patch-repair endonuclease
MSRGTSPDLAIARIAGAQNRVLTWRQLCDAHVSRRAVAHRIAVGRLYRAYPSVYLLEPPQMASRITLLTAAVLACGPHALLSHRSAAELWELVPAGPSDIDVTVVARNPGERPGIARHRASRLDRRDLRTRHAIPVTSPARTALDAATQLAPDDLEAVIATATARHLTTNPELERVLARYPSHPGAARLKTVLKRQGGPAFTRSEAERRMLALVRQAQLPVPATNVPLHGFNVDFLWREQRLVVEIDGFEFHGDRLAFERDRARDAKLVALGFRVIRFTWPQLNEQPLLVIGRLAQALALAAAV